MWWHICKLHMEGTRLSCSLPYRVNFVDPFLHVCKFNHFLSRVTIQIFQLLWLEIESLMSTWEWMYLEGKLLVVDNGTLVSFQSFRHVNLNYKLYCMMWFRFHHFDEIKSIPQSYYVHCTCIFFFFFFFFFVQMQWICH